MILIKIRLLYLRGGYKPMCVLMIDHIKHLIKNNIKYIYRVI